MISIAINSSLVSLSRDFVRSRREVNAPLTQDEFQENGVFQRALIVIPPRGKFNGAHSERQFTRSQAGSWALREAQAFFPSPAIFPAYCDMATESCRPHRCQ